MNVGRAGVVRGLCARRHYYPAAADAAAAAAAKALQDYNANEQELSQSVMGKCSVQNNVK